MSECRRTLYKRLPPRRASAIFLPKSPRMACGEARSGASSTQHAGEERGARVARGAASGPPRVGSARRRADARRQPLSHRGTGTGISVQHVCGGGTQAPSQRGRSRGAAVHPAVSAAAEQRRSRAGRCAPAGPAWVHRRGAGVLSHARGSLSDPRTAAAARARQPLASAARATCGGGRSVARSHAGRGGRQGNSLRSRRRPSRSPAESQQPLGDCRTGNRCLWRVCSAREVQLASHWTGARSPWMLPAPAHVVQHRPRPLQGKIMVRAWAAE